MSRAAALAARGGLRVLPNPPVGCVLLRLGRIVGEGWHRAYGGPHAEVEALRAAGARARGATAFVTLEPCGHHGKTPPCAGALLRAGVREVVYAEKDPNGVTAGLGPAALRAGGVDVRRAYGSAATRRLLARYAAHLRRRRPYVIAKWAMTLDGRFAARSGDARWISGASARAFVHEHFRARVDAIVVGAGTVRADDPALTNRSRLPGAPLRVVVCGAGAIPPRARLLRDGGPTLLAAPDGWRAPRGAAVLRCGRGARVDLRRLFRELHARGMRRVLVEGGPTLLASLLAARLVDQAAAFVAPKLLGDAARMPGAARLADAEISTDGVDLLVEGFVSPR
jgi:diaminohydroxyphosphoribosylaminopyrimidine deaminase/5-amino-6-(5-phosphoribosylamino)uracil reductase